jgi:hypothetical protein
MGKFSINVNGGAAESYGAMWGSPLELGSGACGVPSTGYQDCTWFLNIYNFIPAGATNVTDTYVTGPLTDLNNFPNVTEGSFNLSENNLVIRSLDVQPANDGFAVAYLSSPSVGIFSPSFQHMQLSNLQAFATSEGLQGRVVTALSLDSSTTAYVFSYGWSNDTNSVYEASVVSVTVDTLGATTQNLASQGYVITAFGAGGNPSFGMFVVGTRLKGSSVPRAIFVSSPDRPSDSQYYEQGYVDVAVVLNAPTPTSGTRIWVVEK